MRAVLLTGAAGFIGSHTVEALVARGHRVVGLDNFDPYYSPPRKRANLREVEAALPAGAMFDFVEGDLRDEALVGELIEKHAIDTIVHLAALAGVRASLDAPARYVDVNINGTVGLLAQATQRRVSQFVFASTSSVYGASRSPKYVETEPCDRPLAPYPATKRAGEMMAYAYHQVHGLKVTCLRFFTVYGPRARPDMMTHKLADAMSSGVPVPLYAGGRMVRDWTYVGDTAAGICGAVERPLDYEIINLGRGEPVVLTDYIAALERSAGQKAPVIDTPAPRTDMEQTCADIEKARRLLGYQPKVSLDEGVAAFWAWYQSAVKHAPEGGR
jgi:UDP-glucuronate 4-epimerase